MPSTEHLYPAEKRPGGSLTAPLSAMGEKLQAEAGKWRAMSNEAIAASKHTPAPAEPAAPLPPPAVNWDAELDREALITRRRQPDAWYPLTTEVGANPVQVVPMRPNRKVVLLINSGTNLALIGATEGDVANSRSATFSIAAGASLSLEHEAAVWAASPAGTTIVTIETWYSSQALHRAVWSLLRLATARVGAPKEAPPPSPGKATGEEGLL